MKLFYRIPLYIGCLGIILSLLWSCAEPQAPQGGPKDTQAPRFSKKKYSTPNESTNFQYQQVILTFDEWIKLQNAYAQVVISPPLQFKPEIKVRNKSVVVKWKELLKDSTTYIINFGDAVRDITENNIVKNLNIVFSTGDELDSLYCNGKIIDAQTLAPKEDVWVMLYRNLADSVPLTEKPYYFTKTDAQGAFRIGYIKAGQYRIFALDDQNSDYKYNLPNESIAFMDTSFQISDSIQPTIRLSMFQEREKTIVFEQKLLHYGCLRITYNNELQTPSSIRLLNPPSNYKTAVEQGKDSLKLWFDGDFGDDEEWLFVLENKEEGLLDTLKVIPELKSDFEENIGSLRWVELQSDVDNSSSRGSKPTLVARPLQDTLPIAQHPIEPIKLHFSRPLVSWDSSKIILLRDTVLPVSDTTIQELTDSLGNTTIDTLVKKILRDTFYPLSTTPTIFKDSSEATVLNVAHNWEESRRYQIQVFPNALDDYFGLSNKDTISRVYSINPIDDYGSITALIVGADSSQQYIIQLLGEKDKVIQENVVRDSSQIQLVYPDMKKGNYSIRIIYDDLANGRWDMGNYEQKRQAEKFTTSKGIPLQSGWENTMEIDLSPPEERSTSTNTSREEEEEERREKREDDR